jgi:uncharacterized protein YegP (UPF0339 family)
LIEIASVPKNAQADERYDRKTSNNVQHYFTLTAVNKLTLGKSEMYASAAGMENGIADLNW